MTPEAEAHMRAKLERELFSIERQHCRNVAEREERDYRAAQLRADIANLAHFKVGHP
jgi:hypothetical protein